MNTENSPEYEPVTNTTSHAERPSLLGAVGVALLTAAAVAGTVYSLVVRPRHLRWGATDAERTMPLPGDELVRAQPTSAPA